MTTSTIENNVTIQSSQKVMYKDIIDFGNGSTVSAKFDFTNLRPEDHEMALQIIGTFGCMVLARKPSQERILAALNPKPVEKKSLWKLLFGAVK